MFSCVVRIKPAPYRSRPLFVGQRSLSSSTRLEAKRGVKGDKKGKKKNQFELDDFQTGLLTEKYRGASPQKAKETKVVANPEGDRFLELTKKGFQQAESGNVPAAVKTFHLALSLDNITNEEKAEVNFHLGTVYEQSGDLEKATEHYTEATKLNPQDATSLYCLGLLSQDQGIPRDAIKFYKQAVAIDGTLIEGWVNMGNALEELGHSDEAISAYTSAIAVESPLGVDQSDFLATKGLAHRNLAISYMEKGDDQNATKHLESSLLYSPEDAASNCYLAEIYERKEEYKKAIERYKTALKATPRDSFIYVRIGDIYLMEPVKDHLEAIKHYTVALSLNPSVHKELYYIVGWLHFSRESIDVAKKYLEKALEVDESLENRMSANVILGTMVYKEQPQIGLDYFIKARELGCNLLELYECMSSCYSRLGNNAEAVAQLRTAISISPDKPHLQALLGNELLKDFFVGYTPKYSGQTEKQIAEIKQIAQKGLEVDENHAGSYYLLGKLAYWEKDNEAAMKYLEKACVLPNVDPTAQSELDQKPIKKKGGADNVAQTTEEAHAEFQNKLKSLMPIAELEKVEYLVETLFFLGKITSEAQRYDDAIACYTQMLMLKSDEPEAMIELALAQADKGDVDDGVSTLRRAVILHPGEPRATYQLGNLLSQSQKYDQAVGYYERSLKIVEASGDLELKLKLYNNIGVAYYKLENFEKHTEMMDAVEKLLLENPVIAEKIMSGEMAYAQEKQREEEKEEKRRQPTKAVTEDSPKTEGEEAAPGEVEGGMEFQALMKKIATEPEYAKSLGRDVNAVLQEALQRDVEAGKARDMTDEEMDEFIERAFPEFEKMFWANAPEHLKNAAQKDGKKKKKKKESSSSSSSSSDDEAPTEKKVKKVVKKKTTKKTTKK
eukprot:TRINITY_DN7389_c0_g1_i1.p1 TRINITY_DN7389_c0_g1~~TRINITY_DN7389_c0_g1_i1.p1  ORF type:complete len:897 (+),score=262.95 TRINITY_DN7389_c0_g1_i1:19-2709(+)